MLTELIDALGYIWISHIFQPDNSLSFLSQPFYIFPHMNWLSTAMINLLSTINESFRSYMITVHQRNQKEHFQNIFLMHTLTISEWIWIHHQQWAWHKWRLCLQCKILPWEQWSWETWRRRARLWSHNFGTQLNECHVLTFHISAGFMSNCLRSTLFAQLKKFLSVTSCFSGNFLTYYCPHFTTSTSTLLIKFTVLDWYTQAYRYTHQNSHMLAYFFQLSNQSIMWQKHKM